MKKILIFIGIAVILLVGEGITYLLSSVIISPQNVSIRDINVSYNQVNINGFYGADSALKYSGYETKYENGSLYIKFKGKLVSNNSGEFHIKLDNKSGTINQIYIQGKNSSDKILIWPK